MTPSRVRKPRPPLSEARRRNLLHAPSRLRSTDGLIIASDVRWATGALAKARGLLGRPAPRPGEALVIAGARQVHALGLGYPIDVVFCDAEWRVLHVVSPLAPRRVTKWVRNARWAIEMRTGAAATIARGDNLVVE